MGFTLFLAFLALSISLVIGYLTGLTFKPDKVTQTMLLLFCLTLLALIIALFSAHTVIDGINIIFLPLIKSI